MDIQSVTKAVKKNIGEAIDTVSDKWSNMGKGTKIAMATVAGGVTIITAPFIVAAASGVSIVSALAILRYRCRWFWRCGWYYCNCRWRDARSDDSGRCDQ